VSRSSSSVVLEEYGPAVTIERDLLDLDVLASWNEAWQRRLGVGDALLVATPRGSSLLLEARGVTGFVAIGRLHIEIRPKFLAGMDPDGWRGALWHILARTERRPDLDLPTLAAETKLHSLPDLLGYILLASLRTARLQGLPRGYVERRSRLPFLRGQLDLSEVVAMAIRPDLIPCVYEEFEFDTPLNRILRWATLTLSQSVMSPKLAYELREELGAFSDVTHVLPSRLLVSRLTIPPQYRAVEPAFRVAKLLLSGRTLQHENELDTAPGFLWNSWQVFESFVKRLVQSVCLRKPEFSFTDSGLTIGTRADGESAPLLTYPDVRLLRRNETVAVLDAKYKRWKEKPARDNYYQVIAGGWRVGCKEIGLIYPSPGGSRKAPLEWNLFAPNSPTRLTAIFINLTEMGKRGGQRRLTEELEEDLATLLVAAAA
jgi:McrBC 5-methylcytosine restriction system component